MNRINFNIKDRKFLYGILCIVLVSVFTLTIAYAALNAVLTISGSAQVSSADWDIYLSNPTVRSGSTTTDVPVIKSSNTLEFSTTLNMPGDYYEFTVDVVNGGDIDAMIENVIKTPELTTEQAKYLKYEVSYQNGEAITTKQLLAKDTTMPIKVRIEYRKDLSNTDLPTSQVVLDLALTLEYIQSDGTGISVKDNNEFISPITIVSGDGTKISDEICIGEECFYVISSTDSTVSMLAKYNLYVGGEDTSNSWIAYGEEATGMQNSTMKGGPSSFSKGVTAFSDTSNNYSGSIVEGYVNNYKLLLESNFGVEVVEVRLLTYDELTDPNTFACSDTTCSNSLYSWIYSTGYWLGSPYYFMMVWSVRSDGLVSQSDYRSTSNFGVRPVIVISKDYFN